MGKESEGEKTWWKSKETVIAAGATAMIGLHLAMRWAEGWSEAQRNAPLIAALVFGGGPLVWELVVKAWRREFGSDLLAGLSIVTSLMLGEYLAGAFVVLMLSGGEALEAYAVRSASSVLQALAKRMPSVARKKTGTGMVELPLDDVQVGDLLVVLPHEICPVDGHVVEGHGVMDESYLTGEPYKMSKTPGSSVLSGSVNGDTALTVEAEKRAVDSRYAQIMQVMQQSEQRRPQIRRLGDQLGAWYTPAAVALAVAAWAASGDPVRFLAVLVVATPCPLLIAIPVAVIASISLAARRAIIIRDPTALETADRCRTILFDKTGTLTYGRPKVVQYEQVAGFAPNEVLLLTASLEQYSKHPLAEAVTKAAADAGAGLRAVKEISEKPGQGLHGVVDGRRVTVTSRKRLLAEHPDAEALLPPQQGGLECVVLVDDRYAGILFFRDAPRTDGASFIHHLSPKHGIRRTLLVSGDRESEVRYLAEQVGIAEVYYSQSPEQKLALVEAETLLAPTLFIGDGINDAPALNAASVGIAMGQNSDVTTQAADVVILDASLKKIDEFLHISRRMRRIALQSAVGGMTLSVVGMLVASFGYLPPTAGAVCQEVIDVLAVLNALRIAWPPKKLFDFE